METILGNKSSFFLATGTNSSLCLLDYRSQGDAVKIYEIIENDIDVDRFNYQQIKLANGTLIIYYLQNFKREGVRISAITIKPMKKRPGLLVNNS